MNMLDHLRSIRDSCINMFEHPRNILGHMRTSQDNPGKCMDMINVLRSPEEHTRPSYANIGKSKEVCEQPRKIAKPYDNRQYC